MSPREVVERARRRAREEALEHVSDSTGQWAYAFGALSEFCVARLERVAAVLEEQGCECSARDKMTGRMCLVCRVAAAMEIVR